MQVFVARFGSRKNAAQARDALVKPHIDFGPTGNTNVRGGVLAAEPATSDQHRSMIKAHDAHGRDVVRIQVIGDNVARMARSFDTVPPGQLACWR